MNRQPTTRRGQRGAPQPGTIIVDEGMSKRELALLATASSTLVISVAIAIAVWRISTGLMWAFMILSVGSAIQAILIGAGIYAQKHLAGQAMVIDAQGRADAAKIQAHTALTSARRQKEP